jgi:hypothetical protein
MIQARARGIDITVVTDKSFNTQDVMKSAKQNSSALMMQWKN